MSFDNYKIPEGHIMIAHSDEQLSVGVLGIDPGQELQKHNRPALESLFQIKGKCIMKLFEEDDTVREIILEEGESIDIPPLMFHVHANPFDDESITFWRARGDITEIIKSIRNNSAM